MSIQKRTDGYTKMANYGLIPTPPEVLEKYSKFDIVLPDDSTAFTIPRYNMMDKINPGDWIARDQFLAASCSSFSVCAACEFLAMSNGLTKYTDLSELFMYWHARFEDNPNFNRNDPNLGTTIPANIRVAQTLGVVHESEWRYRRDEPLKKFLVLDVEKEPPESVKRKASEQRIIDVKTVEMNDEKMKAILADDIPIVIGFSIFQPEFESDETKKTGKIALPPPNTNLPFSHAVLCVGFDDNEVNRDGSRGAWIFRNSRGPEWGNKGLGTLPYKYPRLPEQWVVYKFSSVSI